MEHECSEWSICKSQRRKTEADYLRKRKNHLSNKEKDDELKIILKRSDSRHKYKLTEDEEELDDFVEYGHKPNEDLPFPETYIIIEFNISTTKETIYWLLSKIEAGVSHGGADLIIRREDVIDPPRCSGMTIHISATDERLLRIADKAGFVKKDKYGILRNFNISCFGDFLFSKDRQPIDILTPADRQIAMKIALEDIRSIEDEYIPGLEDIITLDKGDRVLEECLKANIINNYYSPHNYKIVEKIGEKWCKDGSETIEKIRNYFGEHLGIYFSYFYFYTSSLVVSSLFGICMILFGQASVPVMCSCYVIWTVVFLEMWKRKCAEKAFNWGTILMTYLDKSRPDYFGELGVDPVTRTIAPQYPRWKTYTQVYFVSLPIVVFGAVFSFTLILAQIIGEEYLEHFFEEDSIYLLIPSTLSAAFMSFYSYKCIALAEWLTKKENHRTQLQHDNHKINKLIILEFFNNFTSLFYIAFVMKDIAMLRKQLMVQLTVTQLTQKLQEVVSLWFNSIVSRVICRFSGNRNNEIEMTPNDVDNIEIATFSDQNPRVIQSQKERFLPIYASTFYSYLQLWVQFGYVILFSSVVPLAAVCALVSNVVQIRLDIFKLGWLYKRPFAERAKNIGSWQLAFEAIAVISIMSNLGIAYITPEIRKLFPKWCDFKWAVCLIILEHICLILIWCVHRLIPDQPYWVRIELAKANYNAQKMLKQECERTTG